MKGKEELGGHSALLASPQFLVAVESNNYGVFRSDKDLYI